MGYLVAHLPQMLDEVLEPVLVPGDVAATERGSKGKSVIDSGGLGRSKTERIQQIIDPELCVQAAEQVDLIQSGMIRSAASALTTLRGTGKERGEEGEGD
jgi:hypothetical protein